MRFDGLDVAVESVSGLFLSVSFGKAPCGNPPCVYPPYGGANDEINSWYDLSWREYGPASDAFGRVVERVLWRADDRFHPLALGLGLGGGVHLRVGDGGDGTMPEPVGPLVASEATEFDDVVLPAGYRKPAFLAPSVDVRRKDSQSHGGDRGSDGTSRATPSHHGHAFLIEWE